MVYDAFLQRDGDKGWTSLEGLTTESQNTLILLRSIHQEIYVIL